MKNKKGNAIVIGIITIILLITVAVMFSLWSKNEKQEKDSRDIQQQTKKMNNPIPERIEGELVYFGSGIDEVYSFVDILTQAKKEIVPAGYKIIGQHEYRSNPAYVILEKTNKLYSFSIQAGVLTEIESGNIKNDEDVVLYPSLTEEGKFYLVINTMKATEEGSMYEAVPVASRKYFLDVAENKLKDANSISLPGIATFSGCLAYDSKYSRFFLWECGEGIGNAIPLSVYTLVDKKKKEVISLNDFGVKAGEFINLEERNGNFFAMTKIKDNFSKIIVVSPTENILKEVFTVSEKVKSQLNKIYPYSNLLIRDKKTIVIGGDDFITLMRFNSNNEIIESQTIAEPEIYANFIFTDGQKLYYSSKDQVKVLNLDTWTIEKTVPISENAEEVNIFLIRDSQ